MLGQPYEIPEDLGPPVLLKRLGNALEGELARTRLADADIPSFIVGVDAFHADPTGPRGQVELFVPQTLVGTALDVLDEPAVDDADEDFATFDDPGRPLAFRALVAAVLGWLAVFAGPYGVWVTVPTFLYAVVLATRAVRRSNVADRGLRFQVAAAVLIALVGLAVSLMLTAQLLVGR